MEKCRLGPSTKFTFLGITVDTSRATFSLPATRAQRLTIQVRELSNATRNFSRVQAREVAQLLGLLWSAAPCCPRGVALMARGLIDVLAVEMRTTVYCPALQAPYGGRRKAGRYASILRRVLASFWSGTVAWSPEAAADLAFWEAVDFATLSAPISADTTELAVTATYACPMAIKLTGVSYLTTDASDVACGGGELRKKGDRFEFVDDTVFISDLPAEIRNKSSALREATAIEWILLALTHRLRGRVVTFCDSRSACSAILRGSRIPELQAVV